ncbi:MAG: maleylpyruvate isomerase N-terminal domain-containing protein [Actinobacteria bacterium]|nr:maleylpyruvate isomerase N-terminal domain-containing protein [Actinomycetota bacterium]
MIRTEGGRLATMPADALDAVVPTLPDWTIERVVRHVGRVHRWVVGLLDAPTDADAAALAGAAPALGHGPACLTEYREALDELLARFEADDPDRPVATFIGPATVAFWMRRQAHETAVHRIDAADAFYAAGGPPPEPIDPVGAADGIGEWLEVFASARVGATTERIAVRATDTDTGTGTGTDGSNTAAAWSIPPGLTGDAAAEVTGSAQALLLTLWRRRPLDTVTVRGNIAVVTRLLDEVRV